MPGARPALEEQLQHAVEVGEPRAEAVEEIAECVVALPEAVGVVAGLVGDRREEVEMHLGERLGGLQQQPARHDDATVGRAQVLARAVLDRAHRLLDRAVLDAEADHAVVGGPAGERVVGRVHGNEAAAAGDDARLLLSGRGGADVDVADRRAAALLLIAPVSPSARQNG